MLDIEGSSPEYARSVAVVLRQGRQNNGEEGMMAECLRAALGCKNQVGPRSLLCKEHKKLELEREWRIEDGRQIVAAALRQAAAHRKR